MAAAALYGAALVLRPEQAMFADQATRLLAVSWLPLGLAAMLLIAGSLLPLAWRRPLVVLAALSVGLAMSHAARHGLAASDGHVAGLWWIATCGLLVQCPIALFARGRWVGLVVAALLGLLLASLWLFGS